MFWPFNGSAYVPAPAAFSFNGVCETYPWVKVKFSVGSETLISLIGANGEVSTIE